jgi:hypothetical protein
MPGAYRNVASYQEAVSVSGDATFIVDRALGQLRRELLSIEGSLTHACKRAGKGLTAP